MTREEYGIIREIVKRVEILDPRWVKTIDKLGLIMDIEFTHEIIPLRLNNLLCASDFELMHDVMGIYANFNRVTKQMDNCFTPRYAQREEHNSVNERRPTYVSSARIGHIDKPDSAVSGYMAGKVMMFNQWVKRAKKRALIEAIGILVKKYDFSIEEANAVILQSLDGRKEVIQ